MGVKMDRTCWVVCAAVLLLAGCDSDSEQGATSDAGELGDSAGTSGVGDTSGSTSGTSADGTDNTTPDATDDPDGSSSGAGECTEGTLVSILRGRVEAEDGSPVALARPQACVIVQGGELICLRPPETNADGAFLQSVPFEAQCMARMAMRVTEGDGTRATTYCPAVLPESGSVLAFTEPFVLFDTDAPLSLPEIGDGSAARDVVFAGDLVLGVTPERLQFAFGAYGDLRAAPVELDAAGLCFLETARPMGGLWAFYPEAGVIVGGEGMPLRFPNTQGYSAGAAVDLFVLGGLDCSLSDGTHVPEGEFYLYGQGHVSADGQQIESDAGSGLPCMTWFGYAPAP